MQPAVPEPPRQGGPRDAWSSADDVGAVSADDVGAFEQGSQFSRWALARYIVGRVILERVSWGLLGIALTLLVLAGLAGWLLHSTALVVLGVILALGVLLMRATLRAVLKRLMAFDVFRAYEERVKAIVDGASQDIFAELRRVGLPSHLFTLPLIVFRLIGRRRKLTLDRMQQFEVERAVPRARRDELYMVLREATNGGVR